MNVGLVAASFGLGVTLGLLPGPVQFVLITEATRGGLRRGFAAQAGANGTLGILLVLLAAGLSLVTPSATALRLIRIVGGTFLIFLAVDAIRAVLRKRAVEEVPTGHDRRPLARGVFAVLLNPGAWIFLATTASALFSTAAHTGGRGLALALAVSMVAGVACIDAPVVLLGEGARRLEHWVAPVITPILAVGLATFGAVLLFAGFSA